MIDLSHVQRREEPVEVIHSMRFYMHYNTYYELKPGQEIYVDDNRYILHSLGNYEVQVDYVDIFLNLIPQ